MTFSNSETAPRPLVEAVEAATGLRPHLSTVLRWTQRRNRFGNRLESQVIGGRRYTTVAAVQAYNEANTLAADRRSGAAPPPSTRGQRSKAHAAAHRELDKEFAS